ncbi:MAG TPA: alpha/beta family hydrolase [Bryobacteraceae bacterium]|nr:alpha/beta family hydrolase [Bryobacteraceae bacterium]
MADGILLTHGAGSNADSPLLLAFDAAFTAAGLVVQRFNLPYRQERPTGPPPRGSAERDREGLLQALTDFRQSVSGRLFAGGHSYGGRQLSMLLASHPYLVEGLLLLSYPLHPPRKPTGLRTAHFQELRVPAFFVHGSRDSFGSIAEMETALKLLAARNRLYALAGAGHELSPAKAPESAHEFLSFVQREI